MKITRVCCQGCGADLEVDESVRFVTCNYCHAKLEVVHDTSVTHTRLMEDLVRNTDRMAGNLRLIELQNDLERLDREWENQRQSYMVRGKNGHTYIPSVAGSTMGGIVAGIVGLAMLGMALNAPHFTLVAVFGLVISAIGIIGGISGVSKANAYRAAEAAYENERHLLAQRIEEARS